MSAEDFARVNAALVDALPELRARYFEERAAWGEEMGPHVVYADLLNPYIAKLLEAPDRPGAGAALDRVFAVLEEMLGADRETADVVRTAVAAELGSAPERLAVARRFMGPLMKHETRDRLPYRQPRDR